MTRVTRIAAVAIAVLLAASLAGCGLRQGAPAGSTGAGPEPAPAASTAPTFDADAVLADLDGVDGTLGEVDGSLGDATDAAAQEDAD